MKEYDPEIYNNREWYESLGWQHRWIEFMVGWWAGEFGIPRVVCDFGAGDGWWCASFKNVGAETAYAVELHDLAREYIPTSVYFVPGDLRKPIDAGGKFDLVICLEVAEHLSKRHGGILCGTLVKHMSDVLLFSAAGPSQSGTGHINLQPAGYWIKQIERYGKVQYSQLKTTKVRSAFRNILNETMDYLVDNVLVFARI